MKTEHVKLFGDIANLRRMLEQTDKMMEILADPSTLKTMNEKDIDNAFDGLMRARTGIANMMALLGDSLGYKTEPLQVGTNAHERRKNCLCWTSWIN
jgi:hypothetical protein